MPRRIQNDGLPVRGHHHVRGLEVAVNDAAQVGMTHAERDLVNPSRADAPPRAVERSNGVGSQHPCDIGKRQSGG